MFRSLADYNIFVSQPKICFNVTEYTMCDKREWHKKSGFWGESINQLWIFGGVIKRYTLWIIMCCFMAFDIGFCWEVPRFIDLVLKNVFQLENFKNLNKIFRKIPFFHQKNLNFGQIFYLKRMHWTEKILKNLLKIRKQMV